MDPTDTPPEASDSGIFPVRLKSARQGVGLTQTSVAEALGVASSTYERWERGLSTPRFETLVQLCDLLDVSADWILGRAVMPPLPVGHFVIHSLVVDAVLGTTDPKVLQRISDEHSGPFLDFGTTIQEGSRIVTAEEALSVQNRLTRQFAHHARGNLKHIFARHLDR